jgi:hypothetical protein
VLFSSVWLFECLILLVGGSWTDGVDSFSTCSVSTDLDGRQDLLINNFVGTKIM